MKKSAILIAGPTASGKSGLAMALAERLGGTVINADSMQVYGDLSILTARPTPADEARVPHRLYGHVPAAEAYSAGRYVAEASAAIGEAHAALRLPIIVGGTGLYLKALLEGLSPIPPIPDDVRRHWRGEAVRLGAAGLHRLLGQRDAAMAARLHPTDTQRLTRALEVLDGTGRSLAEWQTLPGIPVLPPERTLRLLLVTPRSALLERCDRRLAIMLANGAREEVAALHRQRLDAGLPIQRALGVRPLIDEIERRISPEEALARAQAETRHYAKRQLTWIARNMISWTRVSAQETKTAADEIVTSLKVAD